MRGGGLVVALHVFASPPFDVGLACDTHITHTFSPTRGIPCQSSVTHIARAPRTKCARDVRASLRDTTLQADHIPLGTQTHFRYK